MTMKFIPYENHAFKYGLLSWVWQSAHRPSASALSFSFLMRGCPLPSPRRCSQGTGYSAEATFPSLPWRSCGHVVRFSRMEWEQKCAKSTSLLRKESACSLLSCFPSLWLALRCDTDEPAATMQPHPRKIWRKKVEAGWVQDSLIGQSCQSPLLTIILLYERRNPICCLSHCILGSFVVAP